MSVAKTRLETAPAEAPADAILSEESMQCDHSGARDAEGTRLSVEAQEEFFVHDGARSGLQSCADCDTSGAEWASVTYGIYLCTECAGRHRGLGVHLSFVRSTAMDRWTAQQLQRMQLGGRTRFHDFLRGYPQLGGPVSTPMGLATRYGSRAAAFYRSELDVLCCDRQAKDTLIEQLQIQRPPVDEGHLPVEERSFSTGIGSARREGSNSSGNMPSAVKDSFPESSREGQDRWEDVLRAMEVAHAACESHIRRPSYQEKQA
jgi:hypothetical protein